MKKSIALFGGLGLGAGLMYLFDPDKGNRRRAIMRDRGLHLSKTANRELNRKAKDLRNRAGGIVAETKKLVSSEIAADERLAGQIRTLLGRISSHPHAVKTVVEEGKVTVSGLILTDEIEPVLKGITSIGGVKEIENKLEAHASAEHVSSLQGENRITTVPRRNKGWSPPARILAAAAGGGLALYAAKRRDTVSSLLASVGVGLLARSVANKPLVNLLAANGDGAIEVHKTIKINAAPEKVFEIVKNPQYFPNFMSHVREVQPVGNNRYQWTVDGIAGFPVSWETEVTEVVPNESIKWKNAGDAKNGQTGGLRLEKTDDGGTRLHVEMDYRPIGGSLGHFVAGLFSRDPKSEMDDDLLRLKTYIEQGKMPHDAAAKRRNDMKIEEIMTKNPKFCTDTTSLHEVAQMMLENDCGCIPVVENAENKKPIGMITDRDITIRTVAHNKNPLQMIAGEVMTDSVITVTPAMNVEECCQKMERNQIRRVAVVDENGACCGIVAQADIARTAPMFETAELVKDVSLAARAAA